jgi:NAD+ dependent glucose-6-phosphate dehydrogenase
MMRRCALVTGATGRLGRLVVGHLGGSFDVRGICLNPGAATNVVTADLSVVEERWQRAFDGVDIVVHCAGQARPRATWDDVQRNNVDATLNVFATAAAAGVRRVVFMSSLWTMAGYGYGRGVLLESMPTRPTTPYGVSKVVGESIARSFAAHRRLAAICLRIGYCPGLTPDDPRFSRSSRLRHKWLSDRDFLNLVDRSIAATAVDFAIVNGTSANAGSRWDLETGRRLLGYEPVDGLREAGRAACLREFAARLATRVRRRPTWAF